MEMSVARDSLQKAILTMHATEAIRAGAASDFVMQGDTLHWRQELSGMSCEATAQLKAATPHDPAMMNGKMLCGDGELTFALHKAE